MKVVSFKKIKKFFFPEAKTPTMSETSQLQISLKKLSDLIDQQIADEITSCANEGIVINSDQAKHRIKNRNYLKKSIARKAERDRKYALTQNTNHSQVRLKEQDAKTSV